MSEHDKEIERPKGIPDDYTEMAIQTADGKTIFIWGRAVEHMSPDGETRLVIEGMIPE